MDTAGDDGLRLHLCVADDAGPAVPLDEWMSRIAAELAQQKAAISQLIRQTESIGGELSALRSTLAENRLTAQSLRGTSADMRQRMDDLDRRLNKVLALIQDHVGGGQSELAMQHHDYVDEYVALVEQKITGLALDILPDGVRAAPRDKAAFVAAACADLLGTPEVLERQLIGRLPPGTQEETIRRTRDICAGARALRAKVAQGRPQRWEFGCDIASPIDTRWQEPWTGAALDGVIEFVVAPAYVVDENTLLCKQKVFTAGIGAGEAGSAPTEDPAEDPAEG